ncbi:MAG: transglutaminase domain-containing protein, partial [Nitrospirae bacterium]|nr:transglutaminase domain-containing protein [Nitrospirota bacterium]
MKRGKRLLLSCFIFIAGIILNIHLAEGYAPPVEGLRRAERTIGWANVYLDGVKVGYSNCYGKEVEYDSKAAYQTISEFVGRWEGKKTETHTQVTLAKDGRILSYLSKTAEDGEEELVEVGFRGETAYVSITAEGVITKQERPLPSETIAQYAVIDKMVQEGLSLGRKISFPVFNFIHLQPDILTLEVSKKGIVNIDGQEKEIFIIEERWNLDPESITELWIDALGTVYKTETKDLNLTFVSVSEEEAKDWKSRKDIKPSLPRIQANIFIPEANETEYLFAKISKNADDGSPLETLSIEVKRDRLIKIPSVSLPIREYPNFRQATAYVPIDKDIAKVAEEIISGEKDAYLAARKISLWISDNIRKKDPDGFFTTATTSLASGEGDSTDQAILFAALARSVGIPTRLSGGLVGEGSTFSYHVWNEIYLGRWISIDPFLNQFPVDATHIRLSGDKGDEGFFQEISLTREQDFPGMRIEILKLKCAGYEFDPTTILSLNPEEENPDFVEEEPIRIGLIYFANETQGDDLKNIHIGINHLLRRDLFCVRSLAVFGEVATPSSEQISYFTPPLLSAWAKKMGADKLIIGKVRE